MLKNIYFLKSPKEVKLHTRERGRKFKTISTHYGLFDIEMSISTWRFRYLIFIGRTGAALKNDIRDLEESCVIWFFPCMLYGTFDVKLWPDRTSSVPKILYTPALNIHLPICKILWHFCWGFHRYRGKGGGAQNIPLICRVNWVYKLEDIFCFLPFIQVVS